MGGIADYSGSLVLQFPLGLCTTALVQPNQDAVVEVVSLRAGAEHHASFDLAELTTGALRTPEMLRVRFAPRCAERWASYAMGVVHACLTRARQPVCGVRLLIASNVPEGKGVSSSAALEVACMYALAAVWELDCSAVEIAQACQWAENTVAGAPCGIMDQMTAACGEQGHMLRLLCQPSTIEGHLPMPEGLRCYGIDSGIRHAVSGSDYGTVRTAAFMGYRIIAERLGMEVSMEDGRARVEDARLHGYLANMSPHEFIKHEGALPGTMAGDAFLARYGGTTDAVTVVDPGRVYPVRQATAHPVHEHARVTRFAELLLGRQDDAAWQDMGALMRGSHKSYGRCGLGSDGTDRLVDMVRDAGPRQGLWGAKITGGGSGGTVAILGATDAEPVVRDIATRYGDATGRAVAVFAGSSPGAAATGVLRLERLPR